LITPKSSRKTSNLPQPGSRVVVDLSAIKANIRTIRSQVGGTPLIGVVKSDAYGHGIAQVARSISGLVHGFAVFGVWEGAELRASGIKKQILVLGPTNDADRRIAVRSGLTQSVVSKEGLILAPRGHKDRMEAHLKFDTGMGRLGVSHRAAVEVASLLRRLGIRRLAGVWTHLSTASERRFTDLQISRFDYALFALARAGISWDLSHVCASEGVICAPQVARRYGAVRVGLSMYGCTPGPKPGFRLIPAMSFVTSVALVRDALPWDTVSYGHTWRAARNARLAVLPVGYSRGVTRLLSNRGFVLIRGHRAPIRGRVTMDLTVVDVTGIPGVREGDEAAFVGRQGRAEIRAEEMASLSGTVAYEVLCLAGRLNPRIYR